MKNPEVLAFIGARSGSKSVPHKNIRNLGGRPLMAWIIDAAQKARHVNRVVVSTDSEEYADIAKQWGAEVLYIQPKEIATDTSTDLEYITYGLNWLLEHEYYVPDIVLRLVPTAPLQFPEDIDASIELLIEDPEAHSAQVLAESPAHPHKAFRIHEDGKHAIPYVTSDPRDATPTQRQRLPNSYHRANVIAVRYNVIRDMASLSGERIRYHLIPKERAVDIDSEIDFLVAEHLIHKFKPEAS